MVTTQAGNNDEGGGKHEKEKGQNADIWITSKMATAPVFLGGGARKGFWWPTDLVWPRRTALLLLCFFPSFPPYCSCTCLVLLPPKGGKGVCTWVCDQSAQNIVGVGYVEADHHIFGLASLKGTL